MDKILVIQTAFIGDVILATALLESLNQTYPEAQLDILVRKGNESLFDGHPYLNSVLIWNKKKAKYKNLFSLVQKIRSGKYDLLVNPQRFLSTGILTAFSKAKKTTGFDKNPLSILFSESHPHQFGTDGKPIHEIDRNHSLIASLTNTKSSKPKLYPPSFLLDNPSGEKYVTISPGSVWFTKQLPESRWVDFINRIEKSIKVILLGGKSDIALCESIKYQCPLANIEIKAGELSLLESAAVMKGASMNYANDSAPTHLASAVNAPISTVFCSTVPRFGFTPLSESAYVLETDITLNCRPCGLHGKRKCPKGHFKCSELNIEKLLDKL